MSDSILPLGDISSTIGAAPASLASLSSKATGRTVDSAAQDFEAMFATQMLQPMFEGLGVNPLFGGGHGEEAMRSFLLQEYGKSIAKTDRLGIAKQVKGEMLRIQETAAARHQASAASALQAGNAYAEAANQGGLHAAN